jgi:hypothetical protein
MHTGCARYASSRGECPQNPGQCSVIVSSCLASSSYQVNLLDFTYHNLSPAVTNGNYRRLESQFLQDSPSVVLTQTPSYRLAAEAKCYERGTREFATGHYPAAPPLPAGARRRHAIWRERKGKARRSGPEAERQSGEGLALLLRLGKRRSIEPKRTVACRRGLPASLQAASDDARRAPNRSSSATCGKAHAHTGRSSHDQNVLQLPVRPVAG